MGLFASAALSQSPLADRIAGESVAKAVASLPIGERRSVVQGGLTTIFERIAPPAPRPAGPALAIVPRLLSPEAAAAAERSERKAQVFVSVSATVLDHRVSLLRWSDATTEYRAVSNLNFEHFATVTTLERPDSVFTLFLALESVSATALPPDELAVQLAEHGLRRVPDLADFPSDGTSWVIRDRRPASAPGVTTPEAIAALHTHYAAHRWQFEQAARARTAARLETERQLREHPLTPPTALIRYWARPTVASPANAR